MNFEIQTVRKPVRVLVANAICPSAQTLTFKIMIGAVFGLTEQVNLILLVYEDELPQAEEIKNSVGNYCRNVSSIVVTSLLPRITDADVFFFVTNFTNPNHLDLTTKLPSRDFDSLYMILKIAHNFSKYPALPKGDDGQFIDTYGRGKPVFVCNGLIPMDIFKTFSKNVDDDSMFCPTWLENVSRNILAGHLKACCTDINKIYAFAADDKQFYLEIERPILNADRILLQEGWSNYPWDGMSQTMFKKLKMDRLHFNESWLKSELLTKMHRAAKLNTYGSIFIATEIAQLIGVLWSVRVKTVERSYRCLGVISDGCMGTIKGKILSNGGIQAINRFVAIFEDQTGNEGPHTYTFNMAHRMRHRLRVKYFSWRNMCGIGQLVEASKLHIGLPYVVPIMFHSNGWTIDCPATRGITDGPRSRNTITTSIMLQQAIKIINVAAQRRHDQLILFCKKFLLNNVLKQEFLVSSDSVIRLVKTSSQALAVDGRSDDASGDAVYVPLSHGWSSISHS